MERIAVVTSHQPTVAAGARHVSHLTRLGWGLAIPVLLLVSIGVSSIHATDRTIANGASGATQGPAATSWVQRAYQHIGPQTARQLLFGVSGVLLLGACLLPSYRRIGRFAYPLYAIILVLLGLLVLDRYVDIPIVPLIRKTRRWIDLGILRIQPSEFMKVALILVLARYLRFRDSYRTWRGLIPPFLFTLVPMILILKQPDLGTLLMLLPVLFAMLFVAGARIRHLALVVVAGAATLCGFYALGGIPESSAWHKLSELGMKPYQRQRIQVLFKQSTSDPRWHLKQGYQLRQGLTALGTGGITGAGYRSGKFIRYQLLPEEHNDFVFAIIGHQWGLVGCALIILAYVVIVICGLEVAMMTNDPFGRLLAVGVVVMIVMQALLNICMNIGLAPITGMPLPFVSAGGSSLWANFIALGLMLNVAQRRPMLIAHPPFEHRDD